jgi:AraC-like DNA-binding protein
MWALLLVLVLVCASGLSFLRYRSFSPVYEASASFTIKVANPLHATVETYNRETAEQMAKTFPYILTSGVLQQRIREYLGVSYVPSISAKAMESANIFTLTVRDSDPQRAHDVLNAAIACYPEISDFVVGPTVFYLLDETGIPTEPVNEMDLEVVQKLLKYCEEHYREDISIASVSDTLHISESYVTKLFSARLDCSFRKYINRLRLMEVKKLLRSSEKTIIDIMLSCGFNNQSSFNRIFFEEIGCTPREYRQQGRKR